MLPMMRCTNASAGAVASLFLLMLAWAPSSAIAQRRSQPSRIEPSAYAQLRYRHIGPEGNRVSSVAGIARDPNTYYAGAASGGIWKTTDGGVRWQPIADSLPVSSIGALAVAPTDANVVWAGTGEPFIRSNISVGWGVYKSTDAGKTWTRMGLEKTGRISRIVVDPRDPDRVFVAALFDKAGDALRRDPPPPTRSAMCGHVLAPPVPLHRQERVAKRPEDIRIANHLTAVLEGTRPEELPDLTQVVALFRPDMAFRRRSLTRPPWSARSIRHENPQH